MADELEQFTGAEGSGTEGGAPNPDTAGAAKKGRKKKAEGEGAGKAEKPKKEPKPKKDNIAFIDGLKCIASVRKTLQIAIAKKAKSVGRAEAIARYELEIAAAKTKLADLLAEAAQQADPVQALIEMGEEPNKVITHFIDQKEKAFEAILTEKNVKVSRATLKNISNDVPVAFFAALPMDLHEEVVNRHKKNDFRLQAVCKKFNFLADVEAGKIVNKDGKWVIPGQEQTPAPNTENAGTGDGSEQNPV